MAGRVTFVVALLVCSWCCWWWCCCGPPPPRPRTPAAARRRYDVPRYMLDLYRWAARAPGRPWPPPDVVRSLVPTTSAAMSAEGGPHLLEFDVPPPSPGEALIAAELRLLAAHLQPHSGRGRARRRAAVVVHLLDEEGGVLELDRRRLERGPWLSLNVTGAARGGRQHLRLLVSGPGELLRWAHLRGSPPSADERPLLLLSYSTAQGQRQERRKRSAPAAGDYEDETNSLGDDDAAAPRRSRRHRNSCRRRPLYVDFAEINYDSWIVAPSGYEAYQCVGKCFFPVSEHLTPTKHAIVQTLLHGVSPSKAARACCVPTRLEPISVLYVDHRGVLTYRFSYHDMVVAECGCR